MLNRIHRQTARWTLVGLTCVAQGCSFLWNDLSLADSTFCFVAMLLAIASTYFTRSRRETLVNAGVSILAMPVLMGCLLLAVTGLQIFAGETHKIAANVLQTAEVIFVMIGLFTLLAIPAVTTMLAFESALRKRRLPQP